MMRTLITTRRSKYPRGYQFERPVLDLKHCPLGMTTIYLLPLLLRETGDDDSSCPVIKSEQYRPSEAISKAVAR